jgi:hypothetical protein
VKTITSLDAGITSFSKQGSIFCKRPHVASPKSAAGDWVRNFADFRSFSSWRRQLAKSEGRNFTEETMRKFRRFVATGLVAASFVAAVTPASAQWGWGPGWGYGGWGYGGWGYGGWGYGGAIAGAAVAGLAIGAIAASAAQQNQYYYAGYGRPYYGRARWCAGRQALYDDWGNFAGYRRVRYRC